MESEMDDKISEDKRAEDDILAYNVTINMIMAWTMMMGMPHATQFEDRPLYYIPEGMFVDVLWQNQN